MLCSTRELGHFKIHARDGEIGSVQEVYFDDERLVIRHLVVDTGGWITGRQVLVSPHSVEQLDRDARRVMVSLTREQIEKAPGIDTDKPVSRQQEIANYDYYGYPYYWTGYGMWGSLAYPAAYAGRAGAAGAAGGLAAEAADGVGSERVDAEREAALRRASDPHLRSSAEVTGYTVEATDGNIGHVDDFLFNVDSWAIEQVVVDTRNWLPAKRVLIDPRTIDGIDWGKRHVRVNLTREAIKSSEPYEG